MTDTALLPNGPTSLSELSEHDWTVLRNTWSRGADWYTGKRGKRHWQVTGRLGQGAPLFTTRKAAIAYADNLLLWESRHRAAMRQGEAA